MSNISIYGNDERTYTDKREFNSLTFIHLIYLHIYVREMRKNEKMIKKFSNSIIFDFVYFFPFLVGITK